MGCEGRCFAFEEGFTVVNSGHGHVTPRPDGIRARCGGPGLCRECQQEALDKKNKNDYGFLTVLYNYIGPEQIDAAKKRALLLRTVEYLEMRFELEGVPGKITMKFDGRPEDVIRGLRQARLKGFKK